MLEKNLQDHTDKPNPAMPTKPQHKVRTSQQSLKCWLFCSSYQNDPCKGFGISWSCVDLQVVQTDSCAFHTCCRKQPWHLLPAFLLLFCSGLDGFKSLT